MKILKINTNHGVHTPYATPVTAKTGQKYYALIHGEEGRGRWQIRWPLAAREFPSPDEHGKELALTGEYKLVDLKKQDPRGNPIILLALGEQDDSFLVLWSLSPGFRGGATYKVSGKATVLAEGEEAEGIAGRMGGASCPIVLVTGPCILTWHRTGRLYGEDADWTASFDGESWTVAPSHVCAVEDAALNY